MKKKSMRFAGLRQWLSLCAVGILLSTSSCKESDPKPEPETIQVPLGAVLALSGTDSEAGRTCKATLEFAIQDLNQLYIQAGSTTRFSCTFVDSQMDTLLAQQAVASFRQQGIRLLASGPNTSAELNAIKNYLDTHSMLALNCFSTAPSLSIPDDNIFRLVPDDNLQGQALVRMMQYDEIEALVPVWRNDTYGSGLAQTIRVKFTDIGKLVMPGVEYNPGTVDFSLVISAASLQVNEAASMFGPSRVGVLLISFQDIADFFVSASTFQGLDNVKWYGCDANAQKTQVITDTVAGAFACKVRFLAPVMAIGTATTVPEPVQALSERVFEATGLHPDDMTLSAYDAVMILGQCYNLTGTTDPATIKPILPEVCSSYNYLGINRSLNEAGDLKGSNFIFYTVKDRPEGLIWDSYATWMVHDDRIILKP